MMNIKPIPSGKARLLPFPWPYKHMLTTGKTPEGRPTYNILSINQETGAVALVANVTTDEAKAKDLLKRCVDHGVSPTHLKDVLEDWSAE